jgi:hypothetical protein
MINFYIINVKKYTIRIKGLDFTKKGWILQKIKKGVGFFKKGLEFTDF